MLVDSHVNLHGETFKEDLDDVVRRAQDAGVTAMLAISDRLESTDAIKAVVQKYPWMWRSVGVHPHYAKDFPDLTASRLIDMATEPRVIGIGECGLDFYYGYSDRVSQFDVFRTHIYAAQQTGLPLVIHSRDADEEMAALLCEEYEIAPFTPLLHCYTGGMALAETALSLGGYVAFSGIITFKKAEEVRAVAAAMPRDRVILETDCPYLAPMPHRGRRCEPSFLPHVADKLADIWAMDRDTVDRMTTDNFFRLFQRAERTA